MINLMMTLLDLDSLSVELIMGNPNNDSDVRSCSVFLKREKNFMEKETKDFEVLLGYLGSLSIVTIQVQSTSNS